MSKVCAVALALACAMSVSSLAATVTTIRREVIATYYVQLNLNAPTGASVEITGSSLVKVDKWIHVSNMNGANWNSVSYWYAYSMPTVRCEGYHFCGWYTDTGLTNALVFDAEKSTIRGTAEEPMQVYAKWGALESETVTTEPTCVKTGTKKGYCTECAKSVTLTVPALGHDLVHATTVLPTYTQDGYTTERCTRCDYTETEVLPCNGAELVEQIVVVYDSMNGIIQIENIPKNIRVLAAVYSGEQMIYTDAYAKPDETLTVTLPEAVSGMGVKLFFLDNQWIPLGECKTLR